MIRSRSYGQPVVGPGFSWRFESTASKPAPEKHCGEETHVVDYTLSLVTTTKNGTVNRRRPAMMCTDLLTVRRHTYIKILFVVFIQISPGVLHFLWKTPVRRAYLALGSRDQGMGSDQGYLKVLCYPKGPKLQSYQGQAVSCRKKATGACGDLRGLVQFQSSQPPAATAKQDRGARSFHFSREARNFNRMGNVPIFK